MYTVVVDVAVVVIEVGLYADCGDSRGGGARQPQLKRLW